MVSQLLIAQPVVALVLGKSTVFHCGLNGRIADDKKRTSLDFGLCVCVCVLLFVLFCFKAENSCSRRERSGVSVG